MSVRYSRKQRPDVGGLSISTSARVTIRLLQRDGHQVIVIKEDLAADQENGTQRGIEIPVALLPELKRVVAALEENSNDGLNGDGKHVGRPANFAHSSEEELARILDFYHIVWQYEPRTFPIEWDEEGNVVRSFTPDFYLPEHDLYLELTTLKQSLVTKKNRKVRLLRELYPEVNIKILYASDYRKLIEKFSASGTWQDSPVQEQNESQEGWKRAASRKDRGPRKTKGKPDHEISDPE